MKYIWIIFRPLAIPLGFGVFVLASAVLPGGSMGLAMGRTFLTTFLEMLKLLPCAFLLIALFDAWVKRETVERHFGNGSGWRGYAWGMLLAGMSVGGMVVAFPVACSLYRKGARLSVVYAYVGFAGVCRIPMTFFELSFLGGLFTAVRLGLAIPLVLLVSRLLAAFASRTGYGVPAADV